MVDGTTTAVPVEAEDVVVADVEADGLALVLEVADAVELPLVESLEDTLVLDA